MITSYIPLAGSGEDRLIQEAIVGVSQLVHMASSGDNWLMPVDSSGKYRLIPEAVLVITCKVQKDLSIHLNLGEICL